MAPVTINPTIQTNPYLASVQQYLQSQGIDMNSQQGQQVAQESANQVQSQGGTGNLPSIVASAAAKYGAKKLFASGATTAATEGVANLGGAGAGITTTMPAIAEPSMMLPGAAGTTNVATGAATTTNAGTVPTSSTLGSIAPYAGLAGAGLGAYGMYKGIGKGSRKDTAIGGAALGGGLAAAAPLLGFGPVGWGVLAASMLGGATLGGAMGHIKTGKSKAQQSRDNIRKNLQSLGIADKDYKVQGFDIGLDGRRTLPSADGTTHRGYEVDMSNPLAVSTIPALRNLVLKFNPNMGDVEQKQTIGMLANSMTNSAKTPQDVQAHIQSLYQTAKIPESPPPLSGPPGSAQTSVRSNTRSPGISKEGKAIKY